MRFGAGIVIVALALTACSEEEPAVVLDDEALETISRIQENAAPFQPDPEAFADEVRGQLPTSEPGTVPPPETLPLGSRVTPQQIDVALDPDGRPYDVEHGWWDGNDLATHRLGEFSIPGGELRVMDGIGLGIDPVFFGDESVQVKFDVDVVELTLLTMAAEPTEAPEATVGVRVDAPEAAPVAEWHDFEFAYGTDGGLGGLTNAPIVNGALGDTDPGDMFLGEWYVEDDYYLDAHVDPGGTPDVFAFANGFGDGGFPMSRGFDTDGRLVSLVLPTLTYPWRLMVPDGAPPPEVTLREDGLLECLSGLRPVTVGGSCVAGDV